MSEDRRKSNKNTPPTKGDADNIPLLESIVVPGHASSPQSSTPQKKRTPLKKKSGLANTNTDSWANTSVMLDTLKDAIKLEARGIVSDILEQQEQNIVDNIEHYLVNEMLPGLVADLVQLHVASVNEELKTLSQDIDARLESHFRQHLHTFQSRLDDLKIQINTVAQSGDDRASALLSQVESVRKTVDGIKKTNQNIQEITQNELKQLNTVLDQQLTAKLKNTTRALNEKLVSTIESLGQLLSDSVAPIESINEHIERLNNEITTLKNDNTAIEKIANVEAEIRQKIDVLRSDNEQQSQQLEEQFDRAFLRRVSALPKLVSGMVKNQAGVSTQDSVQLDAPAVIRSSTKTKQQPSLSSMEKTYNPSAIETPWYETWEKHNYFAPQGEKSPYCIMIPPPNVTGRLHMGHAFQDTIMDALTRYHRMKGDRTLWQAGTDHAGIATQMVVERQLAAQGKNRHDLGREGFIKKVWHWKEESGGTITRQLRRLGSSLDWSRERFTMDNGLSKAVREVFVKLYEEGLIYRGKRLVNWDPVLHTAVSDLEVVSAEEEGQLFHLRYPLVETNEYIIVATTRPETMLGDAAVAVHPDDERYQHLIGKLIELPLTHRRVPIIADEYVDPQFGTGCVKITPAHDFNDYQVWQRHRDSPLMRTIPFNGLINIFTIDAAIKAKQEDDTNFSHRAPARDGNTDEFTTDQKNIVTIDLIPEKYRGLDRFVARRHIVADLEIIGLLDKVESHRSMIPRGDRSHAVIEPYLTDQWFVRAIPLAEPAIKAVETGKIRFIPENWKNTYYEWMRNIEDWCISRQIWWGHRIPAWYDRRGNVYVGRSEAEVRKNNDLPSIVPLMQDPDVLDTWFSSALWPFSTLGWPEKTKELDAFYPNSVLVTGFDIIFFWVARMIMMGIQFTGEVPFKEVYIHGLVRDADGQKMSKSKGNVLDPLDLIDGIDLDSLIEKRTGGLMQPEMGTQIESDTRKHYPDGIPSYGTDALRFTFAALASTGRDIRFEMGRIQGYRNFCNKLWNAARYVLMNTENSDTGLSGEPMKYTLEDRWINSRLQHTEEQLANAFSQYRFDLAANAIYDFAWNEYCDWYLELSKPVLQNEESSAEMLRGTRYTLVLVLETLLRLAHPIIPFITEEIWQRVAPLAGKNGKTIMLQPYPESDALKIDHAAEKEMEWVMSFILGVRKIRGEMNIAPSKKLPLLLQDGSSDDNTMFDNNRMYLMTLAKLESVNWLEESEEAPQSATALVGQMKLLIPMAGLIDTGAEISRLEKEIEKIRKELAKSEAKLTNPDFINRAPENVVSKERQRISELRAAKMNLDQQLSRMESM